MRLETTQEQRDTAAHNYASKPAGAIWPHHPDLMRQGTCTACGKEAKTFNDARSVREWAISGMCQECQDDTFYE